MCFNAGEISEKAGGDADMRGKLSLEKVKAQVTDFINNQHKNGTRSIDEAFYESISNGCDVVSQAATRLRKIRAVFSTKQHCNASKRSTIA